MWILMIVILIVSILIIYIYFWSCKKLEEKLERKIIMTWPLICFTPQKKKGVKKPHEILYISFPKIWSLFLFILYFFIPPNFQTHLILIETTLKLNLTKNMRFSKNYIMKGVDFNCLFGLMGWFLNIKDLKRRSIEQKWKYTIYLHFVLNIIMIILYF